MKSQNLLLTFSLGMLFFLTAINFPIHKNQAQVVAQEIRPEAAAVQVYQQLNQLPQANQYFSQETGKIASDNTLVSRIIRYHQDVKSRPVNYRLDWQLTMADYFEINEPISESRYPGSQTLTVNPLSGDRKIIKSLTRSQRSKLIDTLVNIYNPQISSQRNSNSSLPSPPSNSSSQPKLPQPGDAQLLLP